MARANGAMNRQTRELNRQTNEPYDTPWILNQRGAKNPVLRNQPYLSLVEKERATSGHIEDVATIFLTNRECPFRCLMCDLWKNTLDDTISVDDIVDQIQFGLTSLNSQEANTERQFQQWKLYNSGNFFDRQAIPPEALPRIADLANQESSKRSLNRLVVECHPKLVNSDCVSFANSLDCNLEVAMGLETTHPTVLPKLNKNMSLEDFRRAVDLLQTNDIDVRAFILLRPPFLNEEEGVEWAVRSCEWAFDCGVQCCVVIPTRAGNGAIEHLEQEGLFEKPKLKSLELAQEQAMKCVSDNNRLFVDLWDVEKFSTCDVCWQQRADRLDKINLCQVVQPKVKCNSCGL